MLTGEEILNLNLIKNIKDENLQIQPTGIDFSVKTIYEWKDRGVIDFTNKDRKIPEIKEIKKVNGIYYLSMGAYMIEFEEQVKIPNNIAGLMLSRSSLNRMGAFVTGALIDPGFEGSISVALNIINPYGLNIKEGARIAQWIFFKLQNKTTSGYSGIYSKKNIKSNKTVVSNKVNINNTHDKFIKLFYSTLVNNPANISNYLSSNFKNYLFTTYKSTDYTNDIQNILSLNSLPSQLHFYMDFSNYSTVYINANQSYLYFNIYFTRYNNSFVVTDITLSEG